MGLCVMHKALIAVPAAAFVGVSALAVAPTASAAEAAPTATAVSAKKIKTFKNCSPIPLPKVKKWNLRKHEVRQIAKAKRWAATSKSRSVIRCESGFDYKMIDGPYKGAWQFLDSTWRGAGGGRYAPSANRAPRFAQDHIAWKLHQRSGWGPWSCA